MRAECRADCRDLLRRLWTVATAVPLLLAWGQQAPAQPIIGDGANFACTPTRVWDGDGPIWCAEGPRVRLAGIAAREMDGSCRANQPCPEASAERARNYLVSLLGGARGIAPEGHIIVNGPTLSCHSDGSAGGTRTAAWCTSRATGDLNCAMVASGHVLRWDRYWLHHRC